MGMGWRLTWGTIRDEGPNSGVLMSYYYPNNYPRGALEETIQVTEGKVINLHFTHFNTEPKYDVLAIVDVGSSEYGELGRFDGSSIPDDIVSRSNIVNILFLPDSSGARSGWRLEWTEVDPPA